MQLVMPEKYMETDLKELYMQIKYFTLKKVIWSAGFCLLSLYGLF